MSGFFRRLLGREASADTSVSGTSAPEAWLLDLFGGMMTSTGLRVSISEALSVPGVSACINVVSEDLAKIPLKLYRYKKTGGKELAVDHPLFRLLHTAPAPWLTSFNWRRATFAAAMSRGNHLTRIRRDGRGEVFRLVPIRPDHVTYKFAAEGEPFFEVNGVTDRYVLGHTDAIHMAYRPDYMAAEKGGILGVSPITRHVETIALAIATERFAAAFFRNGARPSVAVEMPGKFPNPETANRIRARLEAAYSGVNNAFKVAVLELGMKLKELTYKNSDSQLVEIRREQVTQIAQIFGVPPHKVGILDKATFSNIEHQAIEYVTGPVGGMAAAHEAAIFLSGLTPDEQENYTVAYDLNGLLRGDLASRYKAYAIGRQWGWLNADTIREWEDMDPLPNEAGQTYMVPFNMQQVGAKPADDPSNPAPLQDEKEEREEDEEEDKALTNYSILGPDGLPLRRI